MNIKLYSDKRNFTLGKDDIRHWAMLFLLSFVLLLLLSPDSYLADIYGMRCDSAWFFTCGKAWMEGMTPYVDFADSKGPLLWLIYGLAYLLSPATYHGVFWLSVVAYTVAFHFIWLTARMFLEKRESAFVVLAMPFFLFFIVYHNEVRAEDFCVPAICGGIYFTCRQLLGNTRLGGGKNCHAIGLCMAWCLLIKWNYFFMMGGMALVAAFLSIKHREPKNILLGLAGIVIPLLPFAVYFLCMGNLADCINEYFINTFKITGSNRLVDFYRDKLVLTFLFVFIAFFCRRMRLSYLLLLTFLPFYVFLLTRTIFQHYLASAMPFFVFFVIYIAKILAQKIERLNTLLYIALLAVIFAVGTTFNLRMAYFTAFANANSTRIAVMDYLARYEKPKIMFFSGDYGFGLLARALPACKYWAEQKDASREMKKEREKAVVDKRADFIVISNRSETPANIIPLALRVGYRQCYGKVTENGKTRVKPLPLFEKAHLSR